MRALGSQSRHAALFVLARYMLRYLLVISARKSFGRRAVFAGCVVKVPRGACYLAETHDFHCVCALQRL